MALISCKTTDLCLRDTGLKYHLLKGFCLPFPSRLIPGKTGFRLARSSGQGSTSWLREGSTSWWHPPASSVLGAREDAAEVGLLIFPGLVSALKIHTQQAAPTSLQKPKTHIQRLTIKRILNELLSAIQRFRQMGERNISSFAFFFGQSKPNFKPLLARNPGRAQCHRGSQPACSEREFLPLNFTG